MIKQIINKILFKFGYLDIKTIDKHWEVYTKGWLDEVQQYAEKEDWQSIKLFFRIIKATAKLIVDMEYSLFYGAIGNKEQVTKSQGILGVTLKEDKE